MSEPEIKDSTPPLPAEGVNLTEDAAQDMAPPQPAPEASAPAPATNPQTGGAGRFVGLLAGGVVAAGLGFGLATYGVQQGWPLLVAPPTEPATDLTADLAALQKALADQSARIDALANRPAPDLTALEDRLAALEAAPAQTGPDLAALQAEIAALKAQVAQGGGADVSALVAEQVREQVGAALGEADALRAEAEAIRTETDRRGALLRLEQALADGVATDGVLADLAAAGIILPEPLARYATAPMPLPQLQDSFSDAARAALKAAHQAELGQDATLGNRLTSFLKAQTGARPLTPQDGTSPEAILSRAEAALARGDLTATLAELDALPPTAAEPMAEWRAQAQTRLDAGVALAALLAEQK